MTTKPWCCSLCGKRCCSEAAIAAHASVKHPDRTASAIRHRPREDAEESYADRAVQAEQDRAAGVHNPDSDWLLPP